MPNVCGNTCNLLEYVLAHKMCTGEVCCWYDYSLSACRHTHTEHGIWLLLVSVLINVKYKIS